MFTKLFWVQASERAIRTVAQAAISLLTVDATTTLLTANWEAIAAASGLAGLISLLMSVVASGTGESEDPSFVSRV